MSMYRYFAVYSLDDEVCALVDGLHLLVLVQRLVEDSLRNGTKPEGARVALVNGITGYYDWLTTRPG